MAGRGTRSYDVVHRDPRFDLANVSYVHYHPAGDPGAARRLAVLGSCRSSRLVMNQCTATGTEDLPPQHSW